MDCGGPFLVRTLSVTACAVLPAPRSGENLSRRGKASVETGSGMAERARMRSTAPQKTPPRGSGRTEWDGGGSQRVELHKNVKKSGLSLDRCDGSL